MKAEVELLHELARMHGAQGCSMKPGAGTAPAPEVLTALLSAFGVAAGNPREIRESLRQARLKSWQRGLEPVIACSGGGPLRAQLRLPASRSRRETAARIVLEDGTVRKLGDGGKAAATQVEGKRYVSREFTLPRMPEGYHTLEVESGGRSWSSMVISAPATSYSPRGVRDWGAFLPMYAAHSEKSWGAGNFSDWSRLCGWIAANGGGVAGTLPLLATFLDYPACEPGPYSPASRLFWNEFYLDVTRIPEFRQFRPAQKLVRSDAFQDRLKRFRARPAVDYAAEWKARRQVLELLAGHFFDRAGSERRGQFDAFVRSRPEIGDYSRFRATCDLTKASWRSWPQRLRGGVLRAGDYDEDCRRFHLYIQWQAQEQMDQLIAHCRSKGVRLYLDLPLGVHPDSYDVWRDRDHFASGASAGAPPDMFFTKGQNWGFAPLHPERIREQRYRYVLEYLRFQMRHTELLRIDHVMQLHRLYWIPKGCSPAAGVYVSYPAEELYAIFCLESHRNKTMLVGENLGSVPPEVNESMHRHKLRQMFVVQYQQRPDSSAALPEPPRHCVASVNTHDMPMFAAHWRGLDITDHAELGLIPQDQIARKRDERVQLQAALGEFLKRRGALAGRANSKPALRALLRWLAASPAEIVLVNLEDLWGETLPQNTPGTCQERPNWQCKAKWSVEKILKDPELRRLLRGLRPKSRTGTRIAHPSG